MIQLGDRVRDIVTGFEGVAIGRLESLFGVTEIKIQPETLEENSGKPIESVWFEESRVIVSDSNNRIARQRGKNETKTEE